MVLLHAANCIYSSFFIYRMIRTSHKLTLIAQYSVGSRNGLELDLMYFDRNALLLIK